MYAYFEIQKVDLINVVDQYLSLERLTGPLAMIM